jgi:hypothetical protein
MLAQAKARTFRFRVNLWSRLTGRGPFDWQEYDRRLEASEFRSFASTAEARQSLGWVGQGSKGENWLFAVAGYRIPLYGKSAMRHELFHAAQDFKDGLFACDAGVLRCLVVEYSAHLWGGPLIGVPLAYGGSLFILGGVVYLIGALAGAF